MRLKGIDILRLTTYTYLYIQELERDKRESIIRLIDLLFHHDKGGISLIDNVETEHRFGEMGLTNHNRGLLDFLVTNNEEYDLFFRDFWKGEQMQVLAVAQFRKYKINKLSMEKVDFEETFKADKREAMEKLFQMPIEASVISVLNNELALGNLTVSTIFDTFSANKGISVHRIVRTRRK